MRAVLLELGRRPLGLCIWSHFPVELRHSTNGPRRADVTAAEASGRRQPRKKEERQEEGGSHGGADDHDHDPGATLSRPKEVLRCG
jgi:hypothetical protein